MSGERALEGRTALVTGGGTGVGLGIARRLLEAGAAVTIASRRTGVLEKAAERLREQLPGVSLRTVRCDVTVEDEVAAAVARASDASGRLDLAVANAGVSGLNPVLLGDPEIWTYNFKVHVLGTMFTIKHAALAMKDSGGGAIVAVSSPAAVQVMKFNGPYASTKAGVEMLVRSAAVELGPLRIRVNGVRVGLVASEMTAPILQMPDVMDDLGSGALLELEGGGEEIGNAIVYLASPAGQWVTGQILGVDGGLTVWQGVSFEPVARLVYGDDAIDAIQRPGGSATAPAAPEAGSGKEREDAHRVDESGGAAQGLGRSAPVPRRR